MQSAFKKGSEGGTRLNQFAIEWDNPAYRFDVLHEKGRKKEGINKNGTKKEGTNKEGTNKEGTKFPPLTTNAPKRYNETMQ